MYVGGGGLLLHGKLTSIQTPLSGLFPRLLPGSESPRRRESFRQLQSAPLGLALKKGRARGVRKMRSVSPRMRNMRGMGAGMK